MGWGIVLITFGISAMVQNFFTDISDWVFVGIVAAGGVVVLGIFLKDKSDWGVLIPAYVLLATALLMTVAINDLLKGDFIGSVVLFLIGIPFLAVYLRDKGQWWALIPAYIMLAIGSMLLLTEWNIMGDNIVAPFILTSIGLPFLAVYLQNRDYWWALIPAYTMFAVAVLVGFVEGVGNEDHIVPAYVMLVIAFPFLYVYIRNRQNWWALIPGGIMGVIGLSFLMAVDLDIVKYVMPVILIIGGIWVLMRQNKKE